MPEPLHCSCVGSDVIIDVVSRGDAVELLLCMLVLAANQERLKGALEAAGVELPVLLPLPVGV